MRVLNRKHGGGRRRRDVRVRAAGIAYRLVGDHTNGLIVGRKESLL